MGLAFYPTLIKWVEKPDFFELCNEILGEPLTGKVEKNENFLKK